MDLPSEKALHKVAHDITMEFLRRYAPAPLPANASYASNEDERLNSFVNSYLKNYKKVLVRLQGK